MKDWIISLKTILLYVHIHVYTGRIQPEWMVHALYMRATRSRQICHAMCTGLLAERGVDCELCTVEVGVSIYWEPHELITVCSALGDNM